MDRFLAIAVTFLLGSGMLEAQSRLIRGTIQDAGEGMIYLAVYRGDRFMKVDSMDSDRGSFYFFLSDADPSGVYRVFQDHPLVKAKTGNRSAEFIFNRKDLEITVAEGENGPVAYFGDSQENRIYREFMDYEKEYTSKISRVSVREGEEEARLYEELQLDRSRFIDSLSALYPDFCSVRLIRAHRSPSIPGSMSRSERIDTLRLCYFDHAAIDDPALLHAPVYPLRIEEYLSLWRDDSVTAAEQQQKFIEAVEHIMANTSYDSELREFVVNFLMDRFENLQMEAVLDHLAIHYLDEWCESDIAGLVEARKEGLAGLTPGSTLPDFVIRDFRGRSHELSRMDHDYVLVMFWSTTCPHCLDLMPELHSWYTLERDMDLEVVAISIDTSDAAFLEYTRTLHPRWIHAHEPMGWLGRVPSEYFIYSTPSLFLVDRDRTLIDRPVNYRQFRRAIRRLE